MSLPLAKRLALREVTKKEPPRTLLTGMKYEPAASHSDPRRFFERMIQKYGLVIKSRTGP
jgi:hypothetical protein